MTDEMLTATDPEATPLDERAIPEATEETVTERVEQDAAEPAGDETATADDTATKTEDTEDTEDTDDTVDASFDLSEDAEAPSDDDTVVEKEIVDDPWTHPNT